MLVADGKSHLPIPMHTHRLPGLLALIKLAGHWKLVRAPTRALPPLSFLPFFCRAHPRVCAILTIACESVPVQAGPPKQTPPMGVPLPSSPGLVPLDSSAGFPAV